MAVTAHELDAGGRRPVVLRVLVVIAFVTLWLRLWQMQVWQVEEHTQTVLNKILRTHFLSAPRGRILDRNGKALADSKSTWAVVATPSRVPTYRGGAPDPEQFYAIASELARVLGSEKLPTEEVLNRVTADLPSDPFRARLVVDDVDEVTRSRIKELGPELPGIDVVLRYVRDYPHPDEANAYHVIGYASNITADQVAKGILRGGKGYELSDVVGQAGLEAVYEHELRGVKGKETIDARGIPTTVEAPRPGHNLILTLDSRLQAATERALAAAVQRKGHKAGAAIVLDCRNGQVLAMASYPSFRPEWCTSQAGEEERRLFAKVAQGPGAPWENHAITGRRCPASTFKIITLASALEMSDFLGLDTFGPNTHVYCSGERVVSEWSGEKKSCWNKSGHGWVSLREAIGMSCNMMFYHAAEVLDSAGGGEGRLLQQGARAFGLGSKTGIDLYGEYAGLVGDARWLRLQALVVDDMPDAWFTGQTMNMAIGQGFLEATPLQMASATAVIANGGTLVWPHLVKEIRSGDQPVEYTYPFPDSPPHTPRPITISSRTLSIIREGMRMSIGHPRGTGYAPFQSFTRVMVAGKTGTDENKNNSWFTSYAPYNNPRIVVTVFVEEGGHGSEIAAPAAREIYEAAFDEQGRFLIDAGE